MQQCSLTHQLDVESFARLIFYGVLLRVREGDIDQAQPIMRAVFRVFAAPSVTEMDETTTKELPHTRVGGCHPIVIKGREREF